MLVSCTPRFLEFGATTATMGHQLQQSAAQMGPRITFLVAQKLKNVIVQEPGDTILQT